MKYQMSTTATSALSELADLAGLNRRDTVNAMIAHYGEHIRSQKKYGLKLVDGWEGLSFIRPHLYWGTERVKLEVVFHSSSTWVEFTDPHFGDVITLGWLKHGVVIPNPSGLTEVISRHDSGLPAEYCSEAQARLSPFYSALLAACKGALNDVKIRG